MKVGVIWVGYQCKDLLASSLTPWIEARKTRLGGHTYSICAVSVPFEGFPQDEEQDDTVDTLIAHGIGGQIDHVISAEDGKAWKETEARGAALKWLVEKGVDTIWLVDSDEVYARMDIRGALRWLEDNPLITWHRLPLLNYVFDARTYLAEPFTPPRVFRVHPPGSPGYRLHSFYDDNNVLYGGTITRDLKRDIDFASSIVPAALCLPKHFSWMNDERGRKKCLYQQAHFGHCSYRWDDQRGLCFDEAFYAKQGLPLPEVIHA